MKFGTFILQTQGPSLIAVARKAEELGFESLWIPEHIILPVAFRSRYPYSAQGRMPAPSDTPLHDPMLALAYVASATSTIRLATGIYVLPIRNPFSTAKAVASLDVLSGGRFIFGIGIGWLEEEFEAVGMNFKDRALRTREYLELMKALWTQDDPVYQGRMIGVKGFKFMPKPVQKPHPPLIFGGGTEPSLKRAARLGDGWYGIAEGIEETREMISRLREHEKSFARAKPLELTVSPRLSETLGPRHVEEFTKMGVERLLIGVGPGTKDALAQLERFREDVMTRAG